ncbi:hypothetical protein M378DRAFT_13764 [Amanita muscaria Koide BX008]|uniref:Uncharacterized protein n=1 Tax=Amanita muscaria (strain Koide BX008) TaxID=946122 RepID=A0A0C2T375_AMAMK|nr:hypothetical protein M378DRAFT_13764 [Amanita muscaria Koide BX008]
MIKARSSIEKENGTQKPTPFKSVTLYSRFSAQREDLSPTEYLKHTDCTFK